LGLAIASCLSIFFIFSCGQDQQKKNAGPDPAILRADSLRKADSLLEIKARQAENSAPTIQLHRAVIRSQHHLDSIRQAYSKTDSGTYTAYRAFSTVNRKDIQYFKVGDTIMLPDSISKKLTDYSVFPHFYKAAAHLPRIVIVSNKWQAYACYEFGSLVRFAACNTGEERKPTFPGRYAMNWRQKLRKSSLDSTWILPFTWNIHLQAGSAFHQFDMPGRPVSHSCVRQFMPDAEWLFKWGRGAKVDTSTKPRKYIPFTGTPVIILDIFDFARRRGGPWWDIQNTRQAQIELPENPMNVEEALIPISQIPKEARGSLINPKRYFTAEDTLRARGLIREHISLKESINFNKLRKEKALAKAKAAAKQQNTVQPQVQQPESTQ
jgi:hypothetical protein